MAQIVEAGEALRARGSQRQQIPAPRRGPRETTAVCRVGEDEVVRLHPRAHAPQSEQRRRLRRPSAPASPPPTSARVPGRRERAASDYSLALNLVNRQAYFTDIGKKWSRVPRSNVLPEARSRLNTLLDADVNGVGLTTPEENVQHQLRPDASMSLGQRLEQFLGDEGDPAWRAARLTALDMRVPGTGATAHIDFRRSVVRATAPVPLRSFALLCARYVAGLSEPEVAELEATFDGRSTPEVP